ncbi:MAG TPA: ABC-type transport auxiliary lipoprotein family protein [Kofleriaceae bacterium]|nr:ABC-type transport auxiliary lipoprotein family protein [Kofleriaceae bacterium]
MRRAAACALLAACALTSKAEPRELRYFAPPVTAEPAPSGAACARVRIASRETGAGDRLEIARRTSQVEVVPYDTLRWTEPPDAYVRRAVSDALFARAIEPAASGAALVLDVEVASFEQGERGGEVALRFELRDDRRVIARGEVRAARAAAGDTIEAAVAAIGQALAATSDELADRVVAAACPR